MLLLICFLLSLSTVICLIILFHLTICIVLSVRFYQNYTCISASDYPFGNFKLFLKSVICLVLHFTLNKFGSCCMCWLLGSKSFWRFLKCKHNRKKERLPLCLSLPYGSTTIKVMSVYESGVYPPMIFIWR